MAEARRRVDAPVPEVRQLTPADWRAARAGRLAALADVPGAFLASSPHESSWDDDRWLLSFGNGCWVVAEEGALLIGIVRLAHDGAEWHIESVWTHRDYRRSGVASRVVRLLLDPHQMHAVGELVVWVIEPNPAAIQLYQSLGFVPTGERQRIDDGTGRMDERPQTPRSELPAIAKGRGSRRRPCSCDDVAANSRRSSCQTVISLRSRPP